MKLDKIQVEKEVTNNQKDRCFSLHLPAQESLIVGNKGNKTLRIDETRDTSGLTDNDINSHLGHERIAEKLSLFRDKYEQFIQDLGELSYSPDSRCIRGMGRIGRFYVSSTLQQAAANRLGFTAKKTMAMAQQLYEGIDLGSMGFLGLITYMRTDSTHLSDEAIKEVRNYISMHLGQDYLPAKPKVYASKKAAQQAHEAIRPTDVDFTPSDLKPFLTDQQFKLYDIIWRRFVACQMTPAKWNVTNLNIAAQTSLGQCRYKSAGRVLVFDGFTKIWLTSSNEQLLPATEVGQKVEA
ncbi:unnamed protein product, partial [marine sediment metagenome]